MSVRVYPLLNTKKPCSNNSTDRCRLQTLILASNEYPLFLTNSGSLIRTCSNKRLARRIFEPMPSFPMELIS